MASMMDEMQKTLARRRAKVDRSSEEPDSDKQENGVVGDRRQGDGGEKSSSPGKPFSQPGSQAGSESPKPGNRRRHSTRGSYCGQDTTDLVTTDSCGHGAGEGESECRVIHTSPSRLYHTPKPIYEPNCMYIQGVR